MMQPAVLSAMKFPAGSRYKENDVTRSLFGFGPICFTGAPRKFSPDLAMPEAESAFLRECYIKAHVILEYGSGGSTIFAANQPDMMVFSVESDANWSAEVLEYIMQNAPVARIQMHHADIGSTHKWGNPINDRDWRHYHEYPVSVWDRDDFVEPDLVLIDGRFRVACFLTTMLRIKRPTTVLFDDYADRPQYHLAETFAAPVEIRGRMAKFELTPCEFPSHRMAEILETFTDFR